MDQHPEYKFASVNSGCATSPRGGAGGGTRDLSRKRPRNLYGVLLKPASHYLQDVPVSRFIRLIPDPIQYFRQICFKFPEMSAHNRSWQTSDFCISTKPISDSRYYLFGLISVPFDVQTVDVRDKGSVMLILYKDQTSLFLTPLRREVLHPKKDTQLQRHVEARQSCTVA